MIPGMKPNIVKRMLMKKSSFQTPITMAFTASDLCKIFFAIILPPLGVFLERGCNADFFINILLTILGFIPGIIHALYIILKY